MKLKAAAAVGLGTAAAVCAWSCASAYAGGHLLSFCLSAMAGASILGIWAVRTPRAAGVAALVLAGALMAPPAQGAGLLIADGGFGGVLEIQQHAVNVTINNGIAVTKVTQVFKNTENRQVEALYTFPVPKGASVANFSMWINGREMVGEVVEKERARQIYNSYKEVRRDPGLLEQTDYRTFDMRIFPIGPGAEQKVEITYYQELDADHDWATYVYPLATTTRKEVNSRTTGTFSLALDVKSPVTVTALESPSHGAEFVMSKHSENYWQASLEAKGGSLAKDVVLAYHLSRAQTGLDLVTSSRPGEEGFFCLTLTAGEDLPKGDEGMDYVFLLDISGSMGDDGKLLLSKESVGAFINALSEQDRFELMTFNVQPYLSFPQLRTADAAAKQAASEFLGTQAARGGTYLNSALTTAYKFSSDDRALNVVVLSDGLTDPGERATLLQLISQRPRNAKVFCIGVGNDVNRPLLEQLAQDAGGLAAFISRGDDFGRQAQAFRRKLMRPAATDLEISFGNIKAYDLEPKKLPNLYHGAPIRVYGRYAGNGEGRVTVKGNLRGVAFNQAATLKFPGEDLENPEIERMWASRRVDALLKQADASGSRQGAISEVVKLGERYSIVTEYTSFLVLENDAEYQRWKIARSNAQRIAQDRKAQSQLRAQLDRIREKAAAGLGPQPAVQMSASATPAVTRPNVASPTSAPRPAPDQTAPNSDNGQSFSFNLPRSGGGSSPVGPLFVGLLCVLRGLRSRRS